MKLITLIILIVVLLWSCTTDVAPKKELVVYFPEWGVEHQPYYIKDIEERNSADKISVLNYAFALPQPDSSGKVTAHLMNPFYDYQQIYSAEMSIDGIADNSSQALRGHFNQLKKLKARHPHLKVVVSIGGWLGSVYFSDALLTEKSREIFAESCIDLFIRGNLPLENGAGGKGVAAGIFDGIDIDWEYPVSGGVDGIRHNEKDRENLSKFYALIRKKLDAINPDLLLTAAVPVRASRTKLYNIKKDARYLDWYLLMTYDFYGGWDKQTGHLANLLSDSQDNLSLSMDTGVRKFRDIYAVPVSKIIPGAAFYGRSWKNVDSINNGLNRPGETGPGIYEAGFNYYCDLIKLKSEGYKVSWDNKAMAETMYNPAEKIFWSYDETQSIALKRKYVDAYNLRGLMIWEITGDDSAGTLMKTAYTGKMPSVKFDKKQKNNNPPSISIMKPHNNAIVSKGENLVITCGAYDRDGEVLCVEFFVDGNSVGYDAKAPFSWVCFNTVRGDHLIKIIATDNNGAVSESNPVRIVVR